MKTEAEIQQWLVNIRASILEGEENGGVGGNDWMEAVIAEKWLSKVLEED